MLSCVTHEMQQGSFDVHKEGPSLFQKLLPTLRNGFFKNIYLFNHAPEPRASPG